MHAADDRTMADYTALDEELFGDFSAHEDNNPSTSHDHLCNRSQGPTLITRINNDPDRLLDYPHEAATSGTITSQAECYSPPPQPFSMTSGSSPTKSQQYLAPSEPMDADTAPLNPNTHSTATAPAFANSNYSGQLIAENISWMKARITDVHQLLLHYINLRNSHNDMATNMQKEMILRSETKEALERIREQQDQTSEDIPRLQFQIAQLKLDVQNERAARTAAETGMAVINQKLCSYDELLSSMQARLSDYKVLENIWQKEKEILRARIEELTSGHSPRPGSPTCMNGTDHLEEISS